MSTPIELDETLVSDSDTREESTAASPGGLPRAIGRFLIRAKLGAGGHGMVLLAEDPLLGRNVAVKILHEVTSVRSRRFHREAQTMAKLVHENVIVVHDVGTHAGQDYVAMEYVAGSTLARWQVGRSWRDVVDVYLRAGRGLAFAHDAGFVHRDFKPENVLVGDDGRVRVTDFGLVALRDAAPDIQDREQRSLPTDDLTHTGAVMGTPKYMAPEQHLGEAVDARADQFSFCAALYEAFYGRPPFAGGTYSEIADNVIGHALRTPPPSDVPAAIERAVLKGLSRAPADRFASMPELLAVLRAAGEIARTPSHRSRRMLALAGGVVAIAVGVALLVFRSSDEPPGRAQVAIPVPSKPATKMMGHAKLEYDDAQAHYIAGRYERAAEAFLLAYEYQKLAPFLYNAAAAHRMRGRRDRDAMALHEAIALYRRYLVEDPNASDRDVVHRAIADIEAEIATTESARD